MKCPRIKIVSIMSHWVRSAQRQVEEMTFLLARMLTWVCVMMVGCQHSPQANENPGTTATPATPIQQSVVSEDSFDDIDRRKSVTNLTFADSTLPAMPVPKPKAEQSANSVDLIDLGLILLRVTFEKSIDGNAFLFVSETEITNLMYAIYLADTNRIRDDSSLEEASKEPILSTAATVIEVDNSSSLWRRGEIPEGREGHPVSFVTLAEASEFCKWLTARYRLDGEFRLPTENEWLFAAFGSDRQYPWGNEKRTWTGKSTEPVNAHPELKTPDGLYGMWGNVSELVLSPSDGYGGKIRDIYSPRISTIQGPSYKDHKFAGKPIQPRQDYWGYTHSVHSRSNQWGFRIVFVPKPERF